jgi:hypothetical protein
MEKTKFLQPRKLPLHLRIAEWFGPRWKILSIGFRCDFRRSVLHREEFDNSDTVGSTRFDDNMFAVSGKIPVFYERLAGLKISYDFAFPTNSKTASDGNIAIQLKTFVDSF